MAGKYEWLKQALAVRGYTQRDAAKAVGWDETRMSRFISTGRPRLDLEKGIKLGRLIEMDPQELMLRVREDVPLSTPLPPPRNERLEPLDPTAELFDLAKRVERAVGMKVKITFEPKEGKK